VETAGEVAPYVRVRNGLEARISRAVYYEMIRLAVLGEGGVHGVWSSGVFYPVGRA
jgi:hypothetical protein